MTKCSKNAQVRRAIRRSCGASASRRAQDAGWSACGVLMKRATARGGEPTRAATAREPQVLRRRDEQQSTAIASAIADAAAHCGQVAAQVQAAQAPRLCRGGPVEQLVMAAQQPHAGAHDRVSHPPGTIGEERHRERPAQARDAQCRGAAPGARFRVAGAAGGPLPPSQSAASGADADARRPAAPSRRRYRVPAAASPPPARPRWQSARVCGAGCRSASSGRAPRRAAPARSRAAGPAPAAARAAAASPRVPTDARGT